jgi:predicted LPLAT superfamily acyltransferase
MSSWKGKTRGGLAGYRFFIYLLKYTGLQFSYFFLRFVVLYFVIFAPNARKPIFHYFYEILRFSYLKSIRFTFKNFYLLGQVLLDKVALLAGFSSKFTFVFEGEHFIREMAGSDGGFLIGAHIGNWEIAGQLLERIETRVHIVMLEAEHEKIKHLLDSVMTKKKMNIITIQDDFSHLFAIKDALSNNELVAIHGDRFLPGSKTIEANFLGKPALFPAGPFYMAITHNKPVTFVSSVKETDTHYHFYATAPKLYLAETNKVSRSEQLTLIVNEYVVEMEKILRKHPEQWFNYYYFWAK